jgi:hypothetical protein
VIPNFILIELTQGASLVVYGVVHGCQATILGWSIGLRLLRISAKSHRGGDSIAEEGMLVEETLLEVDHRVFASSSE